MTIDSKVGLVVGCVIIVEDNFVENMKDIVQKYPQAKVVDIRVQAKGTEKDFTSEEFLKLLGFPT